MIIAAFHHPCRSSCKLPIAPSPRECMQSIHSSQLFPRFSVAGRPGKSIRCTVLGLVGKRSALGQICGGAGLIKLIKTSLVRASPRAFGELKGRPGIDFLSSSAPLLQELPAKHVGESRQSRLQKEKRAAYSCMHIQSSANMPWSKATILDSPPLRRNRSKASHASQT
jgi:hypothetical protein